MNQESRKRKVERSPRRLPNALSRARGIGFGTSRSTYLFS